MNDRTNRLLRWIDVLLRKAAEARREQRQVQLSADQRVRMRTGLNTMWLRKRREWFGAAPVSDQHPDERDHQHQQRINVSTITTKLIPDRSR